MSSESETAATRVLLVEDQPSDARMVEALLGKAEHGSFTVVRAGSLGQAIDLAQSEEISVVLLDLGLPDSHGLETYHQFSKCAPNLPVVVITGLRDEEQALETVRSGAQDYIVKGRVNISVLIRSVRYAIERKRIELALMASQESERRGAAERRELEAHMQEAQKRQALARLAGGVAHDFNNLLTGILAFATLASEDLPDESPAQDSLEEIQGAARKAANLAKQMLAYSGQGRFDIKPLSLSQVVTEMTELLGASIEKTATLRLSLAPNLPSVDGDETQLRDVVVSLVANASEALGGERGEIVISTGSRRLNAADVAQIVAGERHAESDYVFLEVRDDGCGIAQDALPRIFEPFYTTKFIGRGLGLPSVLGIVQGHDGVITVESEPGKHTVFRAFLLARTATVEESKPESVPRLRRRASVSVLVVDDEQVVLRAARRVLRQAGFDVLVASDGEAAVEVYQQHAARIDAVLLDLSMPKMGGDEAFTELQKINPSVRVVLSSGYNEQDATAEFVGRGLAGFLQKPYEPKALLDKLNETLDRLDEES